MIKNVLVMIFMFVSIWGIFECWKVVDTIGVMGWLIALVFQSIILLQDLFEDEPDEVTKFARKRIAAFNKLMELTNKEL
jgi:hypothetical protein